MRYSIEHIQDEEIPEDIALGIDAYSGQQEPDSVIIPTKEIAGDLLRQKRLVLEDKAEDDKQSLATYEKNYKRIAQLWGGYLPLGRRPLEDHLLSIENKRTRRNEWDYLSQIYRHGQRYFDLKVNPLEGINRPKAGEPEPNPLSREECLALINTPETIREASVLYGLLGHGWRPSEELRIRAVDYRRAADGLIRCFGKQRTEPSPRLLESLKLLGELASNLSDNERVYRAKRTRGGIHEPLGEDGMRDLVYDMFRRGRISGHVVYDLRDTFSQIVYDAGCDEFLAERLMRHKIPGTGDRYRKYPLARLVQALYEYSPLRLLLSQTPRPEQTGESVLTLGGDGGELNSPSRRSCPGYPTGLVSSFILPGSPLLTELSQASR